MNEIIGKLTSQLGIGADQAEGGLGALLGAIQDKAPAGDFGSLLESVPEASGWIDKAKSLAGGESGGGGGLLGKAAGMLGGGGGVAGLISSIAETGMDAGAAKKFLPMALELLKEKAGGEVMEKLAGSVPFLKDAMGGGGLAGKLGGMLGG